MQQRRIVTFLLRPSSFEAVVLLLLSVVCIALTSWSALTHSPLFFDMFFGDTGIVSNLNKASDTINSYVSEFSAHPILYYVVLTLMAVIVGLSVFVAMQSITTGVSAFSHFLNDIHTTTDENRKVYEKEVELRAVVRLLVFILWVVIAAASVTWAFPKAIELSQAGAMALPGMRGVWYIALSVSLVFTLLHLQVVSLRLFLLRPRIFGLEDSIALER